MTNEKGYKMYAASKNATKILLWIVFPLMIVTFGTLAAIDAGSISIAEQVAPEGYSALQTINLSRFYRINTLIWGVLILTSTTMWYYFSIYGKEEKE